MISFIETQKMTDLSVVATCPLGSSLRGTGLSGAGLSGSVRLSGVAAARPASLAILPIRERSERPTKAPEVAAAANAHAFAAANGAESRTQYATTQYTQQNDMWAFRGLEPWSDPA
ncbi:hypothetical protein [Streptomyces niger]|uniref:hypothetical protein n=1 Tax=Streptomyces niger TaxID=66373 RepID=UPI00069CAF63|nr:hypothetical protein [Streptomyces niger]